MPKKLLSATAGLLFILFAIFIGIKNGQKQGECRIGVILPLTGSAAYIGESLLKGMQLAEDEINSGGEIKSKRRRSLSLLIEDSMNDPKTGLSAYRKLLGTKNMSALIGAMSTVTSAIIPLVSKDEITLLCTAVSAGGITEPSQWIFRFFLRADLDAKTIAEYAYNNLKLKKISIIHIQDDFGISYSDVFRKCFENQGGIIASVEKFSSTDIDFKTQLIKIKNAGPEGIYIIGYANNLGMIPKQIRELGITSILLAVGTISQEFVIKQAPEAIEGAYYTTNAFNTTNPQTKKMKTFIEKYMNKHGKRPEYFEVFGYDSIGLIWEAVKQNGCSRLGIKEGLQNIRTYEGAAGEISVNDEREVDFPIVVRKIINGKESDNLTQASIKDK